MLERNKIYTKNELFNLKERGFRIFEINHKKNEKQLNGDFDKFKVIRYIEEARELTNIGTTNWGAGIIIVEMTK